MKRLIPVAITISLAIFSNIFIPTSWSNTVIPLTPTPVRLYLPDIHLDPTPIPTPTPTPIPTPIPPINPTPPAEIPEYFDPLPVLPLALGGDWVEVKRCGNECWEGEDYPTWAYNVASVKFNNPNANLNGPAPYTVTFLIMVINDIQGAKARMDHYRDSLTLPYFLLCSRELELPQMGMDSLGFMRRSFHPMTYECWPANKYPIPYVYRFRIANVTGHIFTYSYNDDELPRAAYLMDYARILEQLVRDKLVYN